MARFSKARWPQDGPVRELLSYLDLLHTAAGRPSTSEIGRAVALARSTVAAFFNGTRLIGRGNLELLVEHLGGDVAHAEALRRKAIVAWVAPAGSPPGEAVPAAPGPAQLPSDLSGFTGRERQIDAVLGHILAVAGSDTPASAAPVAAIAGMGGVGKTSLAVHVAHRCAAAFPDGQLYVNLRDPNGDPLDPAKVLEGFLFALGADVGAIPGGLTPRVDAYRSRLARRRMLVVLDNATGEGQVRPLLPAASGCAALVTSRIPLAGLEGAAFINLDVFDSREAIVLLSSVVGGHRVAAEPQAAEEIIRWCDRIPLALRVAGARLATRPHWSLARLAKALGDERSRLDQLTAGDLAVRASIALSYVDLPEATREAFRMIGLFDTAEVDPALLAAALDTDVGQAGKQIEALVDARLVSAERFDGGGCGYRCHDLVHLFARERGEAEDNAGVRLAAMARVQYRWGSGLGVTTSRQPLRFDRITTMQLSTLDELSDADRAQAYDQLARFHMAADQPERALFAAAQALEVAERLGLNEVSANARVTIHTVRYFGGAHDALAELGALVETCRASKLPRALQRATGNMSRLLCEEGDSLTALEVKASAVRGDPNYTHPLFDSLVAARAAMFTGDWTGLLGAADYLAAESSPEWAMYPRCVRAWISVLRGRTHGELLESELRTILAQARQSGWPIADWTGLAHIAFCRALQRRPHEARTLLLELIETWMRFDAFLSCDWISPAAHAAALCGPTTSEPLRQMLASPSRVTPWVRAARHTITGSLAAADGDHRRAATEHLAAARIYQQMPNLTDHIVAMATALANLDPDDPRADATRHIVQAFADRAGAPALLDNAVFAPHRLC